MYMKYESNHFVIYFFIRRLNIVLNLLAESKFIKLLLLLLSSFN